MPFDYSWESGKDCRLFQDLPNFLLYIPKNKHEIQSGYYLRKELIALFQEFSNKPEAIIFIAEMMK